MPARAEAILQPMVFPATSRLRLRVCGFAIGLAALGSASGTRDAWAQPRVGGPYLVTGHAGAGDAQVMAAATGTDAVRRVVDEYVGLYRKETLAQWRMLFLPTFTSTSTGKDGTITVRTLEQFFESQVRGFAAATEMSETLEHVAIERTGRLATAWADFVFRQDGTSRRGRLVLTLVEAQATWRIASLMFTY